MRLHSSNATLFSTRFFFSAKSMLVAYKAKKTKTVYLLSTVHKTAEVTQTDKKQRPAAILYYNKTKGGVDTADQMLKEYSTRAATRRWPMAAFQNLMDMCAMNAYIIAKESGLTCESRRRFLVSLAKSLCGRRGPQTATTPAPNPEETATTNRKKCKICQKNKTREICHLCKRFVCGKCSHSLCSSCA